MCFHKYKVRVFWNAGVCLKLRRPFRGDLCLGAALIESVILIPCVLFLVIGAVDLSRIFLKIETLNSIAYEGARYAAGLLDLEKVSVTSSYQQPVIPQPMHARVHARVQRLLLLNGVTSYYVITTRRNTSGDEVSVSVETAYEPLLLLSLRKLRVTSAMPYLFM